MCCSYGSDEQKATSARRLRELADILFEMQQRCPHDVSKDGAYGETCQRCGFVRYSYE